MQIVLLITIFCTVSIAALAIFDFWRAHKAKNWYDSLAQFTNYFGFVVIAGVLYIEGLFLMQLFLGMPPAWLDGLLFALISTFYLFNRPYVMRMLGLELEPEPEPEPTPETEPEPEIELSDGSIFERARFEHTWIVASSGHGKTQLLQDLILNDLNKRGNIVVIDSQGEMLEKLLCVVPRQRLVYLSPEDVDYPLALPTFSVEDKSNAVDLYEFIFASLENELTAKQSTVYRYVSRLLFEVKGATLLTMLDILEKGTAGYNIDHLDQLTRNFFTDQFESRAYNDTRQQIAQRLYRVLENDYFRRMFTAPEGKIFLENELQRGKIILINTSVEKLKHTGSRLLGRYWIAQIASYMFSNPDPTPTYLYMDEFQEYMSDDPIIMRLFEQGRKKKLALTVAHQNLDQLSPGLRNNIAANSGTKVVGRLSAGDAAVMKRELGEYSTPERNTFIVSVFGSNTYYKTNFLRLENLVKESNVVAVDVKRQQMEKYGYFYDEEADVQYQAKGFDPDGPQSLD